MCMCMCMCCLQAICPAHAHARARAHAPIGHLPHVHAHARARAHAPTRVWRQRAWTAAAAAAAVAAPTPPPLHSGRALAHVYVHVYVAWGRSGAAAPCSCTAAQCTCQRHNYCNNNLQVGYAVRPALGVQAPARARSRHGGRVSAVTVVSCFNSFCNVLATWEFLDRRSYTPQGHNKRCVVDWTD